MVLGATAAFAAGPVPDPPSELAAVLARQAKRAEKSGDVSQAYVYYSQASALQPRNRGYRSHMAALQSRGAGTQLPSSSGSRGLIAPADTAASFFPTPPALDSITAREYAGERQLAAPPKLNADPGNYDFDLNDTPRALFEKVAARFNLQVVFDGDYPQGGTPVRFRMRQLDYRNALYILQPITGSFVIPISTRAIMVARDSVAKRNDLEQYVALSLHVPQVLTSQELTEIVQVVRQATNVEKIGWDTANNLIVIRDRISRAATAQALLDQLISYRPEVMIDLELLQVTDTDLRNYGLTFTNNFAAVYLGGIMRNAATMSTGLASLLTVGGGRTLVGIAAAQVQALFNESSSNVRSVFSAQLRSASGQAATFHVGDKYPIITAGYATSSASGTASFTTPPAISWEDLGLEIKATPRIHGADADGSGEVTMEISAGYEALSGQSAEGIPVINRTQLSTDIRVRNGEWTVVAGMIGHLDSKSMSGVSGLARLPWVGNFFRQTSVEKDTSNVLIGIRPHIISLPPDENVTYPLRVGSDAHPFTPL